MKIYLSLLSLMLFMLCSFESHAIEVEQPDTSVILVFVIDDEAAHDVRSEYTLPRINPQDFALVSYTELETPTTFVSVSYPEQLHKPSSSRVRIQDYAQGSRNTLYSLYKATRRQF